MNAFICFPIGKVPKAVQWKASSLPFPGKDKSDLWQWVLLMWSDLQRSTWVLSGQTAAWISQMEPPSTLSMTSKAPSSLQPVAPKSSPSVANVLASRWLSFTLCQLLFLTGLKQFKDIQCSLQYSAVFWLFGVFFGSVLLLFPCEWLSGCAVSNSDTGAGFYFTGLVIT